MRCHDKELSQLFTRIVGTVSTIYDSFTLGTPSNLAYVAVADMPLTFRKAAIAIDVFRFYGHLILLRPGFGYLFSGSIIIFLRCLIRRTFSANYSTVGNYLIHVFSLYFVLGGSTGSNGFPLAPAGEIEYHNQDNNPNRAEDCQPDSHVSQHSAKGGKATDC